MIRHRNDRPNAPERVVVLGASGFVAADLLAHLDDLEVRSLALSSSDYDLREPGTAESLRSVLGPGDALYLPKLWWHQVESVSPFNGLVNYWWDAFSVGPDAPYTALLLSMITMAERPAAERRAWQAFFDHYVFRTKGHPLAHLPPEQHGLLGPLKPDNYSKIRARILHLLRTVVG